jgi:hypothetical protein
VGANPARRTSPHDTVITKPPGLFLSTSTQEKGTEPPPKQATDPVPKDAVPSHCHIYHVAFRGKEEKRKHHAWQPTKCHSKKRKKKKVGKEPRACGTNQFSSAGKHCAGNLARCSTEEDGVVASS